MSQNVDYTLIQNTINVRNTQKQRHIPHTTASVTIRRRPRDPRSQRAWPSVAYHPTPGAHAHILSHAHDHSHSTPPIPVANILTTTETMDFLPADLRVPAAVASYSACSATMLLFNKLAVYYGKCF